MNRNCPSKHYMATAFSDVIYLFIYIHKGLGVRGKYFFIYTNMQQFSLIMSCQTLGVRLNYPLSLYHFFHYRTQYMEK